MTTARARFAGTTAEGGRAASTLVTTVLTSLESRIDDRATPGLILAFFAAGTLGAAGVIIWAIASGDDDLEWMQNILMVAAVVAMLGWAYARLFGGN